MIVVSRLDLWPLDSLGAFFLARRTRATSIRRVTLKAFGLGLDSTKRPQIVRCQFFDS